MNREVSIAGTFAPVAPAERIAVLDVLRGFALLGIGLMNIEFFTRPIQGILLGLDASLTGADYVAGWAVMAFVQGKFWTLFSLLFGMGFAVMLERADRLSADPGFNRVYARRLFVLLAIGLTHATMIWAGDILVPYALAGFLLLLLFRYLSTAALWKLGLLLYFVPVVFVWLIVGALSAAQLDPESAAETLKDIEKGRVEMGEAYAAAEAVYRDGSYFEVVKQRWGDSLMQYGWLPMFIPSVLGMFQLGAWFLRSGAMREPQAYAGLFNRLLWIGGPLGALLVVLAMPHLIDADMSVPTPSLALGHSLMTAGSLLLCLAYASAVIKLTLGPLPWLRAIFGPVGRMALTNYLFQSLIFSTVFYGYGFGLWGTVPRAWQLVLVVGVFGLQVLISRAWLARFRYGPMEWLWRTATYGKAP